MSIYEEWIEAKEDERAATAHRRILEDRMIKSLDVGDQLEGVKNFEIDDFKIKITGRMNRKVNGDLLQEIALEAGLQDHLSSLFNWRPTINMRLWKSADSAITKPLMGAITTTAGRPSFSISHKGE